jgi:hypothetical protein
MFDQWDRAAGIRPIDRHAQRDDMPRLAGQNLAVLARLQRGPATNQELAAISLKYTSRISDLRAAGYVIRCEPGPNGRNTYTLTGEP